MLANDFPLQIGANFSASNVHIEADPAAFGKKDIKRARKGTRNSSRLSAPYTVDGTLELLDVTADAVVLVTVAPRTQETSLLRPTSRSGRRKLLRCSAVACGQKYGAHSAPTPKTASLRSSWATTRSSSSRLQTRRSPKRRPLPPPPRPQRPPPPTTTEAAGTGCRDPVDAAALLRSSGAYETEYMNQGRYQQPVSAWLTSDSISILRRRRPHVHPILRHRVTFAGCGARSWSPEGAHA